MSLSEIPETINIDQIIERELACGQTLGPFARHRLLQRAPGSVRHNLKKATTHPYFTATRQGFSGMDVNDFPPASFTAVSVSAVETNMWTPAIWTPIPANDMRAGKAYQIECGGVFSTTATQGTLTLTPRAGQSGTPSSNVTLGASAAIAWAASQTAQPWYATFTMGIRALGLAASGATATGNGYAVLTNGTSSCTIFAMGGAIPTTVDNTAATGLILSATVSAVTNSITAQWALIRSLN